MQLLRNTCAPQLRSCVGLCWCKAGLRPSPCMRVFVVYVVVCVGVYVQGGGAQTHAYYYSHTTKLAHRHTHRPTHTETDRHRRDNPAHQAKQPNIFTLRLMTRTMPRCSRPMIHLAFIAFMAFIAKNAFIAVVAFIAVMAFACFC
jgi:hypothetical protein